MGNEAVLIVFETIRISECHYLWQKDFSHSGEALMFYHSTIDEIARRSVDFTYVRVAGNLLRAATQNKGNEAFTSELKSKLGLLDVVNKNLRDYTKRLRPELDKRTEDAPVHTMTFCQDLYRDMLLEQLSSRPEPELQIYSKAIDNALNMQRCIEAKLDILNDGSTRPSLEDSIRSSTLLQGLISGFVYGIGLQLLTALILPEEIRELSYLSFVAGALLGSQIGITSGEIKAYKNHFAQIEPEYKHQFGFSIPSYVKQLMNLPAED